MSGPALLSRLGRWLPVSPRAMQRLRQLQWQMFRARAWVGYGRNRRPQTPRAGPICVVGFHSSELGIGEGARAFSSALRAAGAEVVDWDITALFGHQRRFEGGYSTAPPAQAAAIVIHLNPHELVRLVGMLGAAPFEGRFCVGYWAWELEAIPVSWSAGFRYVDEVWTPSRFVADAVAARAPRALPVRVQPHPLAPGAARPDRAAFDLPQDAVVVLTAFDIRSGFARKNPVAAVRVFRQASAQAGDGILVCKVAGREVAPGLYDQLLAEIGEGGDVRLMTELLSAAQMSTLIASADIVLSLHRSEGFGLVLAQAMLAGKAVVATGWSGNLEFMTAQNSLLVDYALTPVNDPQGFYDRGPWAQADVADAAAKLTLLLQDVDARRSLGAKAAVAAARTLDPVRLGLKARAWLEGGA